MTISLNLYRSGGKRLFDCFASGIGIVLLSPLMLLIAIVVRIHLGKPVLFRQRRIGLREQPFTILKFRSMTDGRDETGRRLPDSERITGLGRFLRSTSLDELPELFNVLKGEMSLVGPRPLLPRYQPWYTEEERRRFHVRPGITGWAQVAGRNSLSWDQRFRYDTLYVENWGLGTDLRLLFLTIGKVLRREDVHADTTLTVSSLDEERRAMRRIGAANGDTVL
jgi:lipopolysaccharide/colanic/teichoic acid biosynthesis glycosyltransferase